MTDVWKFPNRSERSQKERTKAVAWATHRVGGWRSANVTAQIQRYLADAGYKVDQHLIKRSMEYLVEHDLAIAVTKGKRTVEFIMGDTHLEEPDFVRAQRVRAASHGPSPEPEPAALPAPSTNGHAVIIDDHGSRPMPGVEVLPGRGRRMPRLPSSVAQPRRLDDMLAALKAWHRADPEACDLWVEGVLHDLGVDR